MFPKCFFPQEFFTGFFWPPAGPFVPPVTTMVFVSWITED